MSTNVNTNIEKNSYVKLVAEENQLDYETAYEIMSSIKNKYKITFSEFAKNKLINYSGDELTVKIKEIKAKKKRKRDYAIKKIAESTGWTEEYTREEVKRIKKEFNISARTYWLRELYNKTDEEILEYKEKSKETKTKRIEKIKEITGWTEEKINDHVAYCNANFNVHSMEYYMNFKCWDLTDDELCTFAVDEDSRLLSSIYNKEPVVLNNKLKFNHTFKEFLGRKYWCNQNTSFDEFKEFTQGLTKIFCKPLTLSMGVGTKVFEIPQDEAALKTIYDELMEDSKILAEEFIVQHEKMNEMYAGCVNTVRFTMLRESDTCHKLWSFVRFGSNGIVDNFHGGGMAAAVDVNTGIIISDALNAEGKYFTHHPVSGVQFRGFQIPHWDKLIEITEKAMTSQNLVNYVGWDIAICPDKVVIVEGNATPQVGVYQSILAPTKVGQKPLYEKFLPKPEPPVQKKVDVPKKEKTSAEPPKQKQSLFSRIRKKLKL